MNISTATPTLHFDYHNNDIQTKGECQRCKRAKCALSKTIINKYVTLQRNKDCTLPSTPKMFMQKQTPPPQQTLPEHLPKSEQPIPQSKAKPDIEHEDEANMDSTNPFFGVG
jgi:hypothetical protein